MGESSHRGEDQCENMMLLVRKQQKVFLFFCSLHYLHLIHEISVSLIDLYICQILWARSDVAGWGAFLKVRDVCT